MNRRELKVVLFITLVTAGSLESRIARGLNFSVAVGHLGLFSHSCVFEQCITVSLVIKILTLK